jgi:hypothetical protein
MAVGGDSLIQMGGFAPPMLLAMGTRLAGRVPQHTINTVTTNVPGPQFPLYMLGHQMIEAYPFVPIFGSVRISIAIFSYLGGLNFGVTADYDSAPDIEVLCDGIEAGVAEYLDIADRVPGRNGVGTQRAEKRVARAGASPERSTTRQAPTRS